MIRLSESKHLLPPTKVPVAELHHGFRTQTMEVFVIRLQHIHESAVTKHEIDQISWLLDVFRVKFDAEDLKGYDVHEVIIMCFLSKIKYFDIYYPGVRASNLSMILIA